jgi:REP element-mobilizing transposase RayT
MTLFKNKYRTESNRLKKWDYSSKAIYFITLVTQNRECIFGTIKEDKMILNDKGKIIETELLKSIQIRERWVFHNWVIMPNHIHLLIEIVSTDVTGTHNTETYTVETHCSASLQCTSLQEQSQNQSPKSNYSTKTILPDDTDIELKNLFISYDAYLSYIESINEKLSINDVETHCSASLHDVSPQSNSLSRKPNSISSFVAVFKSITTKQINSLFENDKPYSIWQSNYHDHIVRNYDSFNKIYHYIKNNPKNWNKDSINS